MSDYHSSINFLLHNGPILNRYYIVGAGDKQQFDQCKYWSERKNNPLWKVAETRCSLTAHMLDYLILAPHKGKEGMIRKRINECERCSPDDINIMMNILDEYHYVIINYSGTDNEFPGHTFTVIKTDSDTYLLLESYVMVKSLSIYYHTREHILDLFNTYIEFDNTRDPSLWYKLTGVSLDGSTLSPDIDYQIEMYYPEVRFDFSSDFLMVNKRAKELLSDIISKIHSGNIDWDIIEMIKPPNEDVNQIIDEIKKNIDKF